MSETDRLVAVSMFFARSRRTRKHNPVPPQSSPSPSTPAQTHHVRLIPARTPHLAGGPGGFPTPRKVTHKCCGCERHRVCSAPVLFRFILHHPKILGFGVLLTLFSSFGQTFLISIFVPDLLAAFDISTGKFGMLYAGATLASALVLPYIGRLLDRVPPRGMSLFAALGLALSCFLMAGAWSLPALFTGLIGLRFCAQGLLGLTSSTTMARVFDRGRGKALSIASLGYPIGEGVLPLMIVLLIQAVGWRMGWVVIGTTVLCLLPPAILLLVGINDGMKSSESETTLETKQLDAPPPAIFRDPVFYLLMPANLLMPIILTALFLYQIPLAASKGWTAETMARGFIGFAAVRVVASFLTGPMIDRFTALRILRWQLLPAAAGLAILLLGGGPWAAYLYLALVGVSQGIAGPVMTATWAEVYGVDQLGSIKGIVTSCAIFGTALGPLILGGALDAGAGYDHAVSAALAVLTAVVFVTIFGCQLATRR